MLFAQEIPTDWFNTIIQGGSFAIIAFMVLFGAYFLIKEWPKIRREQRENREAERAATAAEREIDRSTRQIIIKSFQDTLEANTRAHIESYKEQRTSFEEALIRQEDKREREIDKIIVSWEKQIERTIEYIGKQINAVVHKDKD